MSRGFFIGGGNSESNGITQEDLDNALKDKADVNHNHDGAYQPIGNYSLEGHTHSYSELTDKPSIPSVEGLITEATFNALVGRIDELESRLAALESNENPE